MDIPTLRRILDAAILPPDRARLRAALAAILSDTKQRPKQSAQQQQSTKHSSGEDLLAAGAANRAPEPHRTA